jgi:hypothetical protein
MKKTITLLFLTLLTLSYSQENLVFTGGNAIGSGGSVSYSYGQVFYETVTGTNGELTQGVQQAIEIYSLSTPNNSININLALYPNPAISQVTLDLNLSQFQEETKFEIFDLNGRLIRGAIILSNQTNIDIDNLPNATYLLNVFSSNKILKSFKLIKNN